MAWKQRKRVQRKLNVLVRRMNDNIEKDELWKGRFFAHQIKSHWISFEDGSGGLLVAQLRYVDRQTGQTLDNWFSTCGLTWYDETKMFELMNCFIVDYCKVWENEPRITKNNTKDFRGRKREIDGTESTDLQGFKTEYLCRW